MDAYIHNQRYSVDRCDVLNTDFRKLGAFLRLSGSAQRPVGEITLDELVNINNVVLTLLEEASHKS